MNLLKLHRKYNAQYHYFMGPDTLIKNYNII